MNFIIMFMASPEFIKNPYLRAKMVEVLNCWMPRRRWFDVFLLDDAVNFLLQLFPRLTWNVQVYNWFFCVPPFTPCAVAHLLQPLYLKGTSCLLSILWEIFWSFTLTLSSLVLTLRFATFQGYLGENCVSYAVYFWTNERKLSELLLNHPLSW